jgi:hypothetical protein
MNLPNSKVFRQSFLDSGPIFRTKKIRGNGNALLSPPIIPRKAYNTNTTTIAKQVKPLVGSETGAARRDQTAAPRKAYSKQTTTIAKPPLRPLVGTKTAAIQRLQTTISQQYFCSLCKCYVMEVDVQKHANAKHAAFPVPLRISDLRTLRDGRQIRFLLPQERPVQPRENLSPPPVEQERIPCTEGCGIKVFPQAMQTHIKNFHTINRDAPLQHLSATRLPFILLPPGAWEFRKVIEHYGRRSHPHGFFEQVLDWDRIAQIKSLNGILRYIGSKAWFGYAVYEFANSDLVVLECPVIGNAAYVVSGDWKKMIHLTKAELRTEYSSQCVTVVHKGEWLQRIKRALREL